ncbi:MAG: S1C family serine protease [Acidobacteriota bacterium]
MWSRDTRLLLLTIVVSGAVLYLLAQFRFPEAERRVEPPPQPLERIAARVTYDELAAIVGRLERRVTPSVVVLRVGSQAPRGPRTLEQLLSRSGHDLPAPAFVPALRVRTDLVLAFLDYQSTVQGLLGDDAAVPIVIASDPIRQIALVRVPPALTAAEWAWQPIDEISVPRYVASADGSHGGVALRPLFLGRADRFESARWSARLLALGNTDVAAEGAFVFSLDGELIGMVVTEGGSRAVVPAATLTRVAESLIESGTRSFTNFGLSLQSLTAAAAKQAGATSGVLVAAVAPGSLADGPLRTGDLIESINGSPVGGPDGALLTLAEAPPGSTVQLSVRRDGKPLGVAVEVPR